MQHAIRNATRAVIAARDFCGNEREAALDALREAGADVTPEVLAEVFAEADREWARYQRAAGVTAPISPEERRAINRALRG